MSRRALHGFVLATRRVPGLASSYRGLYGLAARLAADVLLRSPGADGVVLHRGLTGRTWEPGVSDIDLLVLRRRLPPEREPAFLAGLGTRLAAARAFLPMLGDLWIGTPDEFEAYQSWGGLRAWEDPPRWRRLAGRAISPAPSRESQEKRRWLDTWTGAFLAHMEISRRFLRPGRDLEEKCRADAWKLYLDFRRCADFISGDGDARAPMPREEAAAAFAAMASATAREWWLDSAVRLADASRKVLGLLAGAGTASVEMPLAADGEDEPVRRLLRACPAALGAVVDAPYHSYLVLPEGSGRQEYGAAADALLDDAVPGVPLALDPATWALLLQSSYLGAPLGCLDGPGPGFEADAEGIFAGWGPRAAWASPPRVPLLVDGLRWEIAAESASWMALWWRSLWIAPGWPNRFVLYHLYTRALALRLTLAGMKPGPFSRWRGLLARTDALRPEEAAYWRSWERFVLAEPADCVDALPRSAMAPEHVEALAGVLASCLAEIRRGGACPAS